MEREIFRAHIEIQSRVWTSRGIIQLVCKNPTLKLRTLQTCDIVNQNGESVKTLEQGLEIETREFNIFKVGQSDLAAAATVDVGVTGFIPLVQRSRQNVDLSTDSQNRSVIRIYKSEKNFAKKTPDKELNLSAVNAYPKKENLSFKFTYGGDDHDVKFANEDEYQVVYYLVSRSRTLTDQERMTRMIGKGYNNTAAVKDAFDNVVLKRLAPSQRAAYANLDFKEMLQKLDVFNELISSRDINWYIKSLKKPNVAVTDFGWLNGALRDADPEFLDQFVAENGMQLIISAVEKQRKSAQVYQVFIVALECLEAIIDKPKTEDTSKFGMEYVFGNENALDFICEQLDHLNFEVRLKVVLLLETMLQFCLEPPVGGLSQKYQVQMLEVCETGKDKMLAALERRAVNLRKPNMWHVFLQQIEDELKRKRASNSKLAKVNMQYMADIVSLINIIIICYPDVEQRIKIRSELEHAGFIELLDQLKEEKDQLAKSLNCKDKDREAIESFDYEVEEFELRRADDKRIAMFDDDVDLTNISEVYEFLYEQCKNNGAAEDLAEIFRYLLLIPVGQEFRPLWRTCVEIIREATKKAKTLDEEDGRTYDTMYQYLVEVLEKRGKGNDPVSLINKKQAEIDQLNDQIANLKYELDEVKKGGGALFGSLSSASLGGSSSIDLISGILPAGISPQPVAVAPLVPKPTLDDSLKSLYRMVKIGAPDAKLKEIMAKKGEPKDNWDSNIKKVREYKAALDAYNAAGGDDQLPVPVQQAPAAPAIPKPTLPEELMFLYKSMKMGAPESRLRNTMAMRKIPKEKWDDNINAVKKYVEDLKAYEAGGPPPAAAAPPARPAPVVPDDLKKYVKLLKMGRPESNVKQAMAMARMPKEKFKEAMEWFEKVKAHEAGAPPAMPGGAVQARPPPPEIAAELKKYVRFFKMKLPESTIKQKMVMQKMGDRFDEVKEHWEKEQAYKAKYPEDGSAAASAAAPSSAPAASSTGMISKQKERKKEKKKPKGPDYETDLWKNVNSSEFVLPDMGMFAPRARRQPRPVSDDVKQAEEEEEEVEAKQELTKLIYDPKILQNLGVFLPKLRRAGISFTTLQQNIWNLSGLDEEMLGSLLSVLDIGDAEWLNIKQNKAPPELLDENSKMYDKLKNIPRITQRIKHCLFKEHFEGRKKDVTNDLRVVQNALDHVKNSKNFPLLLHCIFECFKANQPKKYKDKKGFPVRLLTTVNKKRITKPDGTETTWLYYILETFHKDNPEALDVVKDISHMKAALRYTDLKQMKSSIDKFRTEFNSLAAISSRYQTQKADAGCTDSYKRIMGTFVEEAKSEMEKVTLAYQKVEADTKGLATQLGEKVKDSEGKINTRYWEEIASFHEHCEMVHKAIVAQAERAAKKKKRKGPNLGKMALQASLIASKRKSQATEGSIMAGGEFKKKVKIPNLSPNISASSSGSSMISGFKNKKRDKMKKRHRNVASPVPSIMKKAPAAVKTNMGLPKRNKGLPKRNSGLPPPPPPGVMKSGTEAAVTPNTEKLSEPKRGLPRPPSRGGLPPRNH